MSSNQISNKTFKRKQYAKGFSSHKQLDDFIQNSLDKYHFIDPWKELYDSAGVYSNFIISNKSAIPDLVIYNKRFNKNECFMGADMTKIVSFPRTKFILRAKPINISNVKKSKNPKMNSLNCDDYEEEYRNEDEEIQWEDIDVKQIESTKVNFQSIPENKESNEIDNIEKVINQLTNYNEIRETKVLKELKESEESFNIEEENLKDNEVTNDDLKDNGNQFKENIIASIDNHSLFSSDFSMFFTKENTDIKEIEKLKERLQDNKSKELKISNVELEYEMEKPKENLIPQIKINPEEFLLNYHKLSNPDNNYKTTNQNTYNKGQDMMYQNYRPENDYIDTNDPSSFLENPIFIVKKNLIQRGWFLMTENNRILGNFNSLDLLNYLEGEIKLKNNFNNIWITDYETDIYFTPSNLYEILKETVPRLTEKKKNLPLIGMNRMIPMKPMNPPHFNMVNNMFPLNPINGMNNHLMNKNLMPREDIPMMNSMMPDRNMMINYINPNAYEDSKKRKVPINNMNMQYAMNNNKIIKQNPPVNMNINLQFVKNDINLNNIMLNQQYSDNLRGKNMTVMNPLNKNSFQDNNYKNTPNNIKSKP